MRIQKTRKKQDEEDARMEAADALPDEIEEVESSNFQPKPKKPTSSSSSKRIRRGRGNFTDISSHIIPEEQKSVIKKQLLPKRKREPTKKATLATRKGSPVIGNANAPAKVKKVDRVQKGRGFKEPEAKQAKEPSKRIRKGRGNFRNLDNNSDDELVGSVDTLDDTVIQPPEPKRRKLSSDHPLARLMPQGFLNGNKAARTSTRRSVRAAAPEIASTTSSKLEKRKARFNFKTRRIIDRKEKEIVDLTEQPESILEEEEDL